LSNLILQTRS